MLLSGCTGDSNAITSTSQPAVKQRASFRDLPVRAVAARRQLRPAAYSAPKTNNEIAVAGSKPHARHHPDSTAADSPCARNVAQLPAGIANHRHARSPRHLPFAFIAPQEWF